ncbi:MAG: hypothetical protein HC890_09245 [Chloroflexaceae bacterium]|nr:hypothetical protein [Chloroflexaceae bacterium]
MENLPQDEIIASLSLKSINKPQKKAGIQSQTNSNTSFKVPSFGKKLLLELACNEFNQTQLEALQRQGHWQRAEEFEPSHGATIYSHPLFLRRIVLNFLYHEIVNANSNLQDRLAKATTLEARALKKEIEQACLSIYPWLQSLDFYHSPESAS